MRPVIGVLPKRQNKPQPNFLLDLFSSLVLSYPLSTPSLVVMAIQKEPGQKGVSWSNIAVGTWPLSTLLYVHSCLRALGAIMNMVYYLIIPSVVLS